MIFLTWGRFYSQESRCYKYYLQSLPDTALSETTETVLRIQTSEKYLISIVFLKVLVAAEDSYQSLIIHGPEHELAVRAKENLPARTVHS